MKARPAVMTWRARSSLESEVCVGVGGGNKLGEYVVLRAKCVKTRKGLS